MGDDNMNFSAYRSGMLVNGIERSDRKSTRLNSSH